MTMERQQAKDSASEVLKRYLDGKPRIWHQVLHYSRTGYNRSVQFLIVQDGAPVDISPLVARVTDARFDTTHGGVVCQDEGHDILALLGIRLYGDHKALDKFFRL